MKIDITEDYKDNLEAIAKYVNKNKNEILIMEENDQELICNKKQEVLSTLNDKFWQWFDEIDDINSKSVPILDLKTPTSYIKVQYDDIHSLKNNDIYEDVKDFMKLVYTEVEEQKSLLGETFHWSEVCAPQEPLISYTEEKEYWLKGE